MWCVVSAGRRALLLPGKVTRLAGVLGGPLHLPRPVVRAADPGSRLDLRLIQIDTFLNVSPSACSATDRSGMFSDGVFSYGIEPVYDGSPQVGQLHC